MFLNGWVLVFFLIWNEQGETFTHIQTDFFPYCIDSELSEAIFWRNEDIIYHILWKLEYSLCSKPCNSLVTHSTKSPQGTVPIY